MDDQGHYWSVREDGGGVVFDDGSACDEYGKECGDYDRDMLVYLGTHRDRIVALLEAADGMEDALLDAVADCTENQPTYSAAIKAYRAAKGGA